MARHELHVSMQEEVVEELRSDIIIVTSVQDIDSNMKVYTDNMSSLGNVYLQKHVIGSSQVLL